MDDEKLDKLLEYIKPVNSFKNTEHPLAPDYSNLDNWAAYPEKEGQQFYLPDSSLPLSKNNNDVDVFYIHPTGFFEKTWNSFMEKDRAAYERTEMMLGNQIVISMLLNTDKRLTIHILLKIQMACWLMI
jgi:hypothetical protein